MYVVQPLPGRLPQRAFIAATAGPVLDDLLAGLTERLDLPVLRWTDLAGPDDLTRLLGFDGWILVADGEAVLTDDVRAQVLARADLLVAVDEGAGRFRSLMRRTVRRLKSDQPSAVDLSWVDQASLVHPDLAVVRLEGAEQAAGFAASFA